MEKSAPIFEGYGITLLRREGKTYVRFDAGGIVVQIIEVEVNESQAARLQQGEVSAHKVLLELERNQRGT